MWKTVALSALALLVAVASPVGSATAQVPLLREPATQPREATPSPTARKAAKPASPRKRKARHASRHKWRRHAGAINCFAHEWRAFPTRDRKGYFYTPPGGGIC